MTMAWSERAATPSVLDLFDLSDERLEIVRTMDRNMLILAGPGAGKTYLLVAHAAWLVEQKIARVLLLTFSRNAANEMRQRLNRVLTQPRMADLVATKTLHEHALDIVRVHGHLIGLSPALDILETRDVEMMAAELATKLHIGLPEKVGEQFERYQRCLVYRSQSAPHAFRLLFEAMVQHMREKRKLDWDTCIRFATEILELQPFVLRSLHHHDRFVLIDEAQDCDPAQLRLIDLLTSGKRSHLCVVMDPDQSLYGFRDADPERTLQWMRDLHEPVVFELTENRRCAPRIQALAQYVLGRPRPTASSLKGAAIFHQAKGRSDEARFVHTMIREWVEIQKTMGFNDIAVLARAARGYSVTRQWLVDQHIPIRSAPRNEWSDDERRLLWTLHFLSEWSEGESPSILSRRFLESVIGRRPAEVDEFEEKAFHQQAHAGDFLDDSRWCRLRDRVAAERFKPVEVVAEARDTFQFTLDENTPLLRLAAESRSLHDFLRRVRQGPKRDLHAMNTDGVLVSTFHGAKGLQFEAVFVVAAEEGMIPDFRAKTEDKLVEERRALYVALTRAAKCVVVSAVKQDGSYAKTPSSFLPAPENPLWTPLESAE